MGLNFPPTRLASWILWPATLLAFAFAAKSSLPSGGHRAQFIHFACAFYVCAGALSLAFIGLGRTFREKALRLEYSYVDLALGFGLFSCLLNLWVKVTLNPAAPMAILAASLAIQVRRIARERAGILARLSQPEIPLLFLLVSLSFLKLSLIPALDGLLSFPHDFDSGIMHMTFPKLVLREGHYFNAFWLRAPWHPQLVYDWYIFVMKGANDNFVKALNALSFLQIALLFTRGAARRWMIGPFLLALVSNSPEFRNIIVITSLDAALVFFTLPAFAVGVEYFRTRDSGLLYLLALLGGFAGSVKHFGLMFSAPLLALTCMHLILRNDPNAPIRLTRRLARVSAVALTFALTFIPHYAHNWFNDSSLLFPFSGTGQNGYGWSAEDLRGFLYGVVPFWGHTKEWSGYFQIPWHLLEFPAQYQFFRSGTPYDFLISGEILILFAAIALTGAWKRLRKPEFFLPALILAIQLLSWFKGSQVIRYLFPLSIGIAFYVTAFLTRIVPASPSRCRTAASALLFLMALGLIQPFTGSVLAEPPLSMAARESWITQNLDPSMPAYAWVRENAAKGAFIVHIGSAAMPQFVPEVSFCGDYFGPCRYADIFADTGGPGQAMKFHEWPRISELVRSIHASHLLVTWTLFGGTRPNPARKWEGAIPSASLRCLEHRFYDGHVTDVFEIRTECRR